MLNDEQKKWLQSVQTRGGLHKILTELVRQKRINLKQYKECVDYWDATLEDYIEELFGKEE